MLAIQSFTPQKCTPNLLSARINHNGPINNTERYFQPTKDEKTGTSHAYLRGRHLHGTSVPLPPSHTGAVLRITDKVLPQTQNGAIQDGGGEEEDDEVLMDVKVAEKLGEFEEMVVWGHGESVDEGRDAFVRGVREWVNFAEAMHGDGDEEDMEAEKEEKAT